VSMTRETGAPNTSSSSMVERCLDNLMATLRRRRRELIESLSSGDIRRIRLLLSEISDESSTNTGLRVVVNLRSSGWLRGDGAPELRDIVLIYDKERRRFEEGHSELIKEAARKLFPEATFSHFMSRERDGVHIKLRSGRIDVMPGSVYIWTTVNDSVKQFLEFIERNIFTS